MTNLAYGDNLHRERVLVVVRVVVNVVGDQLLRCLVPESTRESMINAVALQEIFKGREP